MAFNFLAKGATSSIVPPRYWDTPEIVICPLSRGRLSGRPLSYHAKPAMSPSGPRRNVTRACAIEAQRNRSRRRRSIRLPALASRCDRDPLDIIVEQQSAELSRIRDFAVTLFEARVSGIKAESILPRFGLNDVSANTA
jgi:hypothetical protein